LWTENIVLSCNWHRTHGKKIAYLPTVYISMKHDAGRKVGEMDNMLRFFKRLAGKSGPKSYEEQRAASQSARVRDRIDLARNEETNKEILYYLAEKDPSHKVRIEVVKNNAMPPHVSPVLAVDPDQDVRLALAGRLVELLPDVSRDKQSQLYAFVVQSLGTLALDEVLKIRKALSSTLKDHAYAPPKVAGQLARDVEREVSEPVLRFCAALSDEDLLDILRSHPASWVVQAIAARDEVSEEVSEAVIEVEDGPGGRVLIENDGASLTEGVLQYIVEKARSFAEWHKPMAMRKSLPGSVARALAEFVDHSVRDILLNRDDFDPETAEEVAAVFRRRVDLVSGEEEGESVEVRLQRALDEGRLNEDLISDAIAMRDYQLAYGAIAHMTGAPLERIETIFDSRSAKAVVAISWLAGLPMRLALTLQRDVARIKPKELIYPKGGTDYPMSEDELNWQLEFLGFVAN
jgi:uncharacterized protein (DUF2336 family)